MSIVHFDMCCDLHIVSALHVWDTGNIEGPYISKNRNAGSPSDDLDRDAPTHALKLEIGDHLRHTYIYLDGDSHSAIDVRPPY